MSAIRRVIFMVALAIFVTPAANAQDVTLTSRDGSVEIHGSLVGFDGEFYQVKSEFGVLTVDGSGVECSGPACPNLDDYVAELVVSGDRAIGQSLLPALIETFAQDQGYLIEKSKTASGDVTLNLSDEDRTIARILIKLTSASEGFADLIAQEADMVVSLREVFQDEVEYALQAGLGDLNRPTQNRVIALDAIVPVVSARNPVNEISVDDLIAIYTGQLTNWKELGGLDAPILAHARDVGAGASDLFLERFLLTDDLTYAQAVKEQKSDQAIVDAVESDPFAIGLVPLSVDGKFRHLSLVGGCGFRTGAEPSQLKSEDYPMTAPVFLYLTRHRLPAVGRELVRFMQSPAAQIAVLRSGYVDQTISRTPISRQGDRIANAIAAAGADVVLADLQEMVDFLYRKKRLSVTFRFDDGSAQLDAQSRSNVLLLARALERGVFGSGELTLVGFSDGEGSAVANKELSTKRAQSVRDAVISEAATIDPLRFRVSVTGFGEAMPMACDTSGWGRKANRRVEVWSD